MVRRTYRACRTLPASREDTKLDNGARPGIVRRTAQKRSTRGGPRPITVVVYNQRRIIR